MTPGERPYIASIPQNMKTNRIEQKFETLKRDGRTGLVAFLIAGDPDMATSETNFRAVIEGGADVLEIGVPFSDPTADGPTIQAAGQRALKAGTTLSDTLELVGRLRRDYDTPIVLFGYANPFLAYGYKRLGADAARAGVDGLLVVDMPFEESGELLPHLDEHALCFVPLIAPTTPEDRANRVLSRARGFIYYVSLTGVTGARTSLAEGIGEHVTMLRRCSDLPVAVGFGISGGDQARQVAESADAVVVGSAFIQAAVEGRLPVLVKEIRDALDGAS